MFSQTFANHTPITAFIVLSTVESTNNYAMAKLHAGMVDEPTCFLALEQLAGKGQRGKQWFSVAGENITMSTVFTPAQSIGTSITTSPFAFSASMALACYDFIKDYAAKDLTIKWPNDLFVGDRKAGGILIENLYRGNTWSGSVVGTGINLNQDNFDARTPNAISLQMMTSAKHDLLTAGKQLFNCLLKRYSSLPSSSITDIMKEYNDRLYKRGLQVRLKKGNAVFEAIIDSVSDTGELVTTGAIERRFSVGEIEFAS